MFLQIDKRYTLLLVLNQSILRHIVNSSGSSGGKTFVTKSRWCLLKFENNVQRPQTKALAMDEHHFRPTL
jgi:hypothetical protein